MTTSASIQLVWSCGQMYSCLREPWKYYVTVLLRRVGLDEFETNSQKDAVFRNFLPKTRKKEYVWPRGFADIHEAKEALLRLGTTTSAGSTPP